MDTATIKRPDGSGAVDIRRGRGGHLVIRTENFFLFFIAAAEALILATLMTLNYFLRFDPDVRADCDMFFYDKVLLSCDPNKVLYEWSRPYYDYEVDGSKSIVGLPLNYELPEWVFFLCLLLVPIGIFCIVEGWYALYPSRRYKEIITIGELVVPQVVRRIFRIIGGFLLGGSVTGIFVSVMKFCIISPRPHFMSVCLNITTFNTQSSVCKPGEHLWHPDQKCAQSIDQNDILEAMKSYPSYHSSLAVYAGVFTVAYCVMVAKTRGIYGIPLGFFMSIMVMTGIGATHRLATGHSFHSDLFAGALIGAIVALFVSKITLYRFKEHIWKAKILNPPRQRTQSDNLLPVKELNEQKTSPSQVTQKESDDENDWDSDESGQDYKRISAQITTFPVIPRAHPPAHNHLPQTTHAVNSSIATPPVGPQANERRPVNRSSSVLNPNQRPDYFNKGEIHHSSMPRNQAVPWTTEASGRPSYSSPRHRLSSLSNENRVPFDQTNRYDQRRGYDGPFLSAYKSSSDNKNDINF